MCVMIWTLSSAGITTRERFWSEWTAGDSSTSSGRTRAGGSWRSWECEGDVESVPSQDVMKDLKDAKAGLVAELPALREERNRDAVSLYGLK